MKERIFTTKEQGRVLVEAGLPISTAIGFRDKYLDSLHSMEDDAGRIGLIEAVTPDISNPVWDVGTLLNLLPYEIEGSTFECYKLENTSTRTGKKNSVNRITKINTTTSRLDCRSRSLKSLTIRSGSKRSDGLRLLSIVEFQTTLVLSPVPFQRTVLVNISYQFL